MGKLRATPADADASTLGDPTLLRYGTPLSSLSVIGNEFGEEFAKKLTGLPIGEWSRPIESPFGMHLVRVAERHDAHVPPLEEIRKDVERTWRTTKRDQFTKDEYDRLRAKYEVVLPGKDVAAAEGGAK